MCILYVSIYLCIQHLYRSHLSDTVNTAKHLGRESCLGKVSWRKGYLSQFLKEVMELAWCRPGAMGHPRGVRLPGQKLRVRQAGRGDLRVTIWRAG